MKGRFASLAVGLLGFGGMVISAHGQGIIQQCNGCTENQYDSLAKSLGLGNHLIGDFTKNAIYGYHVMREPNGKGGYIYETDPLDVTSGQLSAFGEYRKLIVDYHASAIMVNIPNPRPSGFPAGADGVSAVNWAGFRNYQSSMAAWFSNLQQQLVDVSWLPGAGSVALLAMQSGVTVNGYASVINFQFQTTAGAIVTLQWSDGKTTLISVIDQYGNHVPIRNFDGPTNFNGDYLFSDTNPGHSQSLLDYLNGLGAKITVNPSQFPSWYICVGAKCDVVQPN